MGLQRTEVTLIGWQPDEHYPEIASWYEGHGMEIVPQDFLPCYGAIVADAEGNWRCAGWFTYDTVNKQAHYDWFLGNPAQPLTLKYAVPLFECISNMAQRLGAIGLWAQTHDDRMKACCERVGFHVVGNNVCNLMYRF